MILNWNGRAFLQEFLPALHRTTYGNHEVIVADNASTDDSVEFLRNHYPHVRIIINNKNYGFARGYNEALKFVTAEYYVLLNSDVEVNPGWLEPMVNLLEGDPQIAACQPKILSHKDKGSFEYAGAAGGWIDELGYPFSRGRIFDHCERDAGQYDDTTEVFWATGASLFIRAKVYHDMGGLDNYFFAHQEEIDLCWRIQLAGGKIYVCPASVVYHVGGGTLPKGNSMKTYLNFRNNLIMLWKNLDTVSKCWVIPARFALDWATALKGLLSGDSGYFRAVLRAQGGFVSWLVSHQSESVFPQKRHGKISGYYRGSVVWQHFVRKRNRFSEIVVKRT